MFFNKPPKNQKMNIRFFLPFTLLMVVIVISLTSIMYYNYQETTLPIMYDHISENLQQSGYSTRYMMESVNNLLSQMYLDSKIITLMYSSGNHDALELRNGQKTLSSFMNASPFVHSIYVYNSTLDSFITSLPNMGMEPSDQFFDDTILDIINNYDTSKRLTPIPRQVKLNQPLTEGQSVNCYTFIYFESTVSNKITDAIIVNINQSYVHDLLNDFETAIPNTKLVIDDKGRVILESNEYDMLEDLSSTRFVEIILASDITKGYFVTSIDNHKSLVSYTKLDVPQWILINRTSFDYLSARLIRIRVITLVIGFLLLLFGLVASTLLSRHKYRPIKQVLENVSTLEDNRRRNYYVLRQASLRKMVQLGQDDYQALNDQTFKNFQIQINLDQPLNLFTITLDDFTKLLQTHSQKDLDLIKFSVINIVNEISSKYYKCEAIDMSGDHFVVLLNKHSLEDSFNKQTLLALCGEIQEMIANLLKLSTTLIIGPSLSYKAGIRSSYNDTIQLLDYRLLYGRRSIIDYDHVADNDFETYRLSSKNSKQLVEYVLSAKPEEAGDFYDQLLMDAVNYTAASVKYLHIQLAFAFNEALSYIRPHDNHQVPGLANIIESINHAVTLDELRLLFNDYFTSVAALIKVARQPKHQELVTNIKAYIQEEYMNENLSLNVIADYFDMSPMYTGRLFKQQVGQSIANYINDVRLAVAKGMLKNTNHTINDIADMIGMTNTNYFYSLFKKKHGVTPTVYRNNNKR